MKIKYVLLGLLSFSLLGLFGCGEVEMTREDTERSHDAEKIERMERLVGQLKSRVEQLEVRQIRLLNQIDSIGERKITLSADGDQVLEIEELISNKVAEHFSVAEERRVASIALEEIMAHESRQEEARRREAETRREEREAQREERELRRVADMAADLGLSDRQAEELRVARAGLRVTVREVFEYMREQGEFNRDTMRDAIAEIQEEHTAVLRQFMTADQVDEYLERYAIQSFMGGGRGGRREGGGPR